MTVLLVLGCIALALFLVSLIRVGIWGSYAQGAFTLRLRVGPVRVTLFPRKAKKRKGRKPGQQQKEERLRKRKKPKQPVTPQGKPDILGFLRELLPVALEAAGELRRKIRIDEFDLAVKVASSDPAKAAVRYGRLSGAAGMLWPLVEQNFKVKSWRIRIWVDFTTTHPEASLRAAVTLTIGQALSLALRTAVKLLPILSKLRPGPQKAGQETQKEAV